LGLSTQPEKPTTHQCQMPPITTACHPPPPHAIRQRHVPSGNTRAVRQRHMPSGNATCPHDGGERRGRCRMACDVAGANTRPFLHIFLVEAHGKEGGRTVSGRHQPMRSSPSIGAHTRILAQQVHRFLTASASISRTQELQHATCDMQTWKGVAGFHAIHPSPSPSL